MPSRNEQAIEMIAWRTLDQWVLGHPKPRLTPRMRHSCKLWIRRLLSGRVSISEVDPKEYFYQLNDAEGEEMIRNAESHLND